MSESVLQKSTRGSAYSIAVSAVTILLGFIRSVLLMRLLAPEMFGLVSLALFFAVFAAPFAVLGLDNALVQRKEPTRETFSTHLLLRLALAAALLLLGLAAWPFLKRLYSAQAAVADIFLILLSLNLLDASYSTSGVLLRREMRFGAIALLNLAASLAMTITAPLLAYLGAGVWSLVAEQAVGPLVRWVGTLALIRPWRFSFRFDRGEARSLLQFGRPLLHSNLLGILMDRFDDFWIGTALGPLALGYYSRAYELAQYPERVLATPVTNVFFSAYSAVQEDRTELSRAFFRSSSFLVRAGLLLAVFLIVSAPELVRVLFGPAWLPIIPVFRWMAVYIILNPFYVNLSYLIVSVGQPALLARVRALQVLLFILAVVGLAYAWGIYGAAIAANLMMLGGTALLVIASRRYTSYSLGRMFLWPLVAAALSAAASLLALLRLPPTHLLVKLAVEALLVLLVYTAVLYAAERQIFHEYILQPLRPLWRQLRA